MNANNRIINWNYILAQLAGRKLPAWAKKESKNKALALVAPIAEARTAAGG